jgi:hypothetical protein
MSALPPTKKNVTLSTKIGLDDAAALKERARLAGVTVSTFLREAALTGQVQPHTPIPQINQEQWADLARVGGNLNQVATHLHGGGPVDARVAATIDECRAVLSTVRAAILGLEVPRGM